MAETTGISWTDATINFWHGCQKVSEGCKYCYMFRDKEKYGQDGSNVAKTGWKTISGTLDKLRKKAKERAQNGITDRLKIFTCSWSDFFIQQADEWREEAWNIIGENPEFDWQILTKRIERVKDCLPRDWGEGWPHVWLGVSAENERRWYERVPLLQKTPAAIRFVSCEPLIGPIVTPGRTIKLELLGWDAAIEAKTIKEKVFLQQMPGMDWIIIGGESGNEKGKWLYREASLLWFYEIIKECEAAKVPVFVKQLGTYISKKTGLKDRSGANPEEWGDYLKLMQKFPKTSFDALHV